MVVQGYGQPNCTFQATVKNADGSSTAFAPIINGGEGGSGSMQYTGGSTFYIRGVISFGNWTGDQNGAPNWTITVLN